LLLISIIIELLVRLVGQEEEQQFRLQVFKIKFREKFNSGLILVMLVFRFKLLSFSLINLVKQVIFRAVQFILETYFKELLQKLLMLVLDQHL
jgi:hypothetical protein